MATTKERLAKVANVKGEVREAAPATKKLFSANLRFLMEQHGVKSKELCKILNVSENTICYWRAGTRYPTATALQALANYFGVDQQDFFDRHGTAGVMTRQTQPTAPRTITDDSTTQSDVAVGVFEIHDDAMAPIIQKNDRVIYHAFGPSQKPRDGALAVVEVDGTKTVRRIFYAANKVTMVASDRRYPPMVFDLDSPDYAFIGSPATIQRNISNA